jgi:hypothetical protein
VPPSALDPEVRPAAWELVPTLARPFQVADIQKVRVYVRVPQAFLADMTPGTKARLELPQYPDHSFGAPASIRFHGSSPIVPATRFDLIRGCAGGYKIGMVATQDPRGGKRSVQRSTFRELIWVVLGGLVIAGFYAQATLPYPLDNQSHQIPPNIGAIVLGVLAACACYAAWTLWKRSTGTSDLRQRSGSTIAAVTYAALAILTLFFQIDVRLPECRKFGACAGALAKSVGWSIVWPASWIAYHRGAHHRT